MHTYKNYKHTRNPQGQSPTRNMEYLAFLVALVMCTRGKPYTGIGRPRNGVKSVITTTSSTLSGVINLDDTLGIWFGVPNKTDTVTMTMCNFPFTYRGNEYNDCIRMYSDNVLWCSLIDEHIQSSKFGKCTKVIQRNPVKKKLPIAYSFNTTASIASADGTCYRYILLSGTMSFLGIRYVQLKTIEHCKLHCNTISICRGIRFSRKEKLCYIIIDIMVNIIPDGEFVHYNRRTCKTTNIAKPPNTKYIISTTPMTKLSTTKYITSATSMTKQNNTVNLCVDKFIIQIHTTASGGTYVHNATTIELCKQLCLSLNTRETEEFCFGIDFDETEEQYKCFLYNNESEFTVTENATNIFHYTRNECVSKGYYEYNINTHI